MKSSRERILEEVRNYVPHDTKRKGLNPALMQELHDKIAKGEIDAGPMPDHTVPVKDIRPQMSGEQMRGQDLADRNGHSTNDERNFWAGRILP